MNTQNQKGFTLVEIAIVLVIIGLLLGGVLKGQELIENAKIKSDTDTLQAFQVAHYAHLDRVGVIAGIAADGTNPRQVVKAEIDPDTGILHTIHAGTFFTELHAQGFLNTEFPIPQQDGIDGTGGETPRFFVNFHDVATASDTTGTIPRKNQVCIRDIKSDVARGMDVKMDDGVWNTGSVRAHGDYGTTTVVARTLCLEL